MPQEPSTIPVLCPDGDPGWWFSQPALLGFFSDNAGAEATFPTGTAVANPGDQLYAPANTASVTVTPTATTTYTVIGTDGVTGCTSSATSTITIVPPFTPTAFCQPGCCLFRWWFRPVGFSFTFRYLYVLLDSCCWFERSFQRKPGCFRNHVNHGIHGDGYLHRQHLFCYCHYFVSVTPLTTVTPPPLRT